MSNNSNIKHVLVIGQPTQMVEDLFPHLDPNEPKAPEEVFKKFGGFTYVDAPSELVDPNAWTLMGGQGDVDVLTDTLLCFVKKGGVIYLGSALERTSDDHKALVALDEVCPNSILDEAIELLKLQLGEAIADPDAFETAVIEAMDTHNVTGEKVIFASPEDETMAAFHAPLRASKTHTLKWCVDGTIELDGAILRRTALMGIGHLKTEVLGGRVLEPGEVVGFIANRMALNGVDDLVGYGRAFGPGKEDHTNATLTDEGRQFRAHGIVGVVSVHGDYVSKAKPAMVELVAQALHQLDPKQPLFLHQQVKEIYEGEEAMKAFRAQMEADGRITLYGKSTKHTRVDAGAYCLYTPDGTGTLTRKAVIGNFEVGNDGSIYAPKSLMDDIKGYLKESVVAKRDFGTMSEDLLSRYYNAEVVVKEGDRLEPGDVVFTIDGIPHCWDSKADYGIVTHVIDTISTKLVHCEVRIDAWFEGDCKMRGFGKGLIAPSEACGVTCSVKDAIIIGAAGIIKDSAAAKSKMSNERREHVWIEVEYNDRDFELAIAKHNPTQLEGTGPMAHGHEDDILVKRYEGLCTLYFYRKEFYGRNSIRIDDENAIVADITFMIEASPVGQAVGSSSMTLPQMGFLSSLPTGNAWLCEEALPGVVRRVDALTYLHAVANGIPVEL